MANELVIQGTGEAEVKMSREEALAEMNPSDAVLVKMEIGAQLDCIFEQIEHIANANSPMVHGKMEDGTPFRMWCDGWLTNLFDRMPRVFGMLVRLKRLGDRDYGKGLGHSYALMDLKRLRALAAKNQPATEATK